MVNSDPEYGFIESEMSYVGRHYDSSAQCTYLLKKL